MLLKGLEIEFDIQLREVEEVYPPELTGSDVAEYLAKLKSEPFVGTLQDNDLLITSDTIVLMDDRVIGKPKSKEESLEMVRNLSDRKHEVVTAVALTSRDKQVVFHDLTEVHFNELSEDEVQHYVDKYEPFDKAGSYGVQEFIGYVGIRKLNGCYYNVMGLPLQMLYKHLKNW